MENEPLVTTSNRTELKINQGRNDETRHSKKLENGDMPALKLNYARQTHTHQMAVGHNASPNSIPEILTERILTQSNPLPQQFTEFQKLATNISPDNTFPMANQRKHIHNSDSGNPINRLAEAIADFCITKMTPKMVSDNNKHKVFRWQKQKI